MVEAKTLIWWTAGVGLFIFLLAWYFDLLNLYAFGWALVIGLCFTAGSVYLRVMHARRDSRKENRRGFEYCWRRTNELLSSMDNPDHLQWQGGRDAKTTLKAYTVGTQQKWYRAMYGTLVRAKLDVVVIYCVDDDDIVDFVSSPSPRRISDPFADFSPSEGGSSYDRSPYYDDYRGRRGRRGRGYRDDRGSGGFQPAIGLDDYPDEDNVDAAFEQRRGK